MKANFICIKCGLRISGTVRDGNIYPENRTSNSTDKPQQCVCAACREKYETHCRQSSIKRRSSKIHLLARD